MINGFLLTTFLYCLLIQYSKTDLRWKYSLIAQFIVGGLIIELAWLHIAIHAVFTLVIIDDISHWTLASWLGLGVAAVNIRQLWQLHQQGKHCDKDYERALKDGLGDDYLQHIMPSRREQLNKHQHNAWLKPFSFNNDHLHGDCHISYGPDAKNVLDIFSPTSSTSPNATSEAGNNTAPARPVMLHIHGGAWMLGSKQHQGLPLRNKLVEAGWIFITINYRLSPAHRFPAHLIDCKRALVWIKENIADYGGDPNFIMTTGGSAGGHLCSLLGLSANRHQQLLQPGFEDKDTRVAGCLPMYGVYDFADRHQLRSEVAMTDFLENTVMPSRLSDDPELWDMASPIAQLSHQTDDCPPFMLTHGDIDTLAFKEGAQYFANALKQYSQQAVVYAELATTQHAFDVFYSPRSINTINYLHVFSEYIYSQYLSQKKSS